MDFLANEEWAIIGKNIILTKETPENIQNLRKILAQENFRLKFASLPELMNIYMNNPSLFNPFYYNEKKIEISSIITDTNEILGLDLEGKIYGKNEKVIVHTHGLYFPNGKTEEKKISEKNFSKLLEGIAVQEQGKEKEVKVYKEDELKRKRKSRIEFPCVSVIRAEKYFRDPWYYCNELEYTQLSSGFEKNGLLMSRILQEPSEIMEFIKEETKYFSQTSPLLEPVIFKGSNNLFSKYSYRIMPLILSEAEIIKEAKDKIDLFENKSQKNEKYFVFLIPEKIRNNRYTR